MSHDIKSHVGSLNKNCICHVLHGLSKYKDNVLLKGGEIPELSENLR